MEKIKDMSRPFHSINLYCRLLSLLTCASWSVVWSGGLVWGQSPPSLDLFNAGTTVKEMGTTAAWVNASDPDGDTLTYTWTFESDPTGKAVFYDHLERRFSTMLSGPQWTLVTFGVGDPGEGPPGLTLPPKTGPS